MIITHSSLECFKQCRQKYKNRYLAHIYPVLKSNALEFGSAMHEVLQQLFETIEAQQTDNVTEYEPKESIISRLCEMIDITTLEQFDKAKLKGLITGYVNKWYESDCQKYEIVDVEKEFCKPLEFGTIKHSFVGKVDGIIRDKETGKFYILEHKTASIVDDDYINQKHIDSQTMTYALFIMDTMQIKVSGAVHDLITKQKIRQKKGETDDEFAQRLIDDVSDDNFERIVIEFDDNDLVDFRLELNAAIDDLVCCSKYYKCTCSCIGRYGACEYLPFCKNKCDLCGIEDLYEYHKPFEEISNETLESGRE